MSQLDRRGFIRFAGAVGFALPTGIALASCSSGSEEAVTGTVSASNPFGVASGSTVDAVIFDGGYGTDYVDTAGKILSGVQDGVSVKLTPSTQIATQMQPRFVAGNPPDLLDNSGADKIADSALVEQVEDLTDVIDAPNLEGTTIRDTLYDGMLNDTTINGKLVAINYCLTLYGIWYSASLFEEKGWSVPATWAEILELGAKAKAENLYLFGWGKEAADYYLTMAIDSAIVEGGHDVRKALGNLDAGCWSLPAVQSTLEAIGQAVAAGYFRPGGAGTQFTAAQAQWSQAQEFVLYPSGSWIENEMKEQTAKDFQMTGFPAPPVTGSSVLPATAVHASAGEPFFVPSKGKNTAGGKELLRTMLSKEAATAFAEAKLASTIVKGTVPADGFGSTALVSQTKMVEAAGGDAFTHNFKDLYGLGADMLVLWNSFLAGDSTVAELTEKMQKLTDAVREDDSVTKVTVS
ncbi:N-acetylglucosamine/diacetylchitobiose ABC transporter substrate-binding protein [Kineosporia sp. J2-2]|uniref:N-acetylglucosamine/diacetylchitobiose ABC transporter substrate-binding protein n=1 Tax=Kineosporia corallincola TaxID=2835133 RepID=A0ABS5TC19_9ACTN|nr:N-acetylglucosamine/diacetylchitobiose ABC transporter substrate-binding protein [Kineosporia corallincola]MBT0768633.1 N-acetylglucosamine/diacetylchitobiose ABC transporter substrate-binding protein [Kineosporia corallincola]